MPCLLQNPLAHTAKAAAAAFGELLTVAQLQEESSAPSADGSGGLLEEVTWQLLALGVPLPPPLPGIPLGKEKSLFGGLCLKRFLSGLQQAARAREDSGTDNGTAAFLSVALTVVDIDNEVIQDRL